MYAAKPRIDRERRNGIEWEARGGRKGKDERGTWKKDGRREATKEVYGIEGGSVTYPLTRTGRAGVPSVGTMVTETVFGLIATGLPVTADGESGTEPVAARIRPQL